MTKRALFAVAGFVALCLPLSAQQTDSHHVFSALNNRVLRFPSLTLSDGADFSFANAIETTAPSFLPSLTMASVTARSGNDSSKETATADRDDSKAAVNVQRSNPF